MKITVVGTGYVGLVTGACLAEMGNHVVCLDRDPGRIATLLRGELPIHEPGLLDIVLRNTRSGRLVFTGDVDHAVAHGRVQPRGRGGGIREGQFERGLDALAPARVQVRHRRRWRSRGLPPVGPDR